MTAPHVDLHSIGQLAKTSENPKMQAILQWVGLGCILMTGVGAAAHLIRDFMQPHREPFPRQKHRELLDDLDRHHGRHEGHRR